MTPANFVAYCVQITIVVALCAGLPRILGLRSPGVQYAFWRLVLAVCLALPLLQPWRPAEMVFVPAPVQIPSAAGTPRALIGSAPDDRAPRRDWTDIARTILLVGIGGRLFWVALGAVRLRSLRRRASDSPADSFEELQQALGTRAQILWSSDVRHPVTFGAARPVVLLPDALKHADPAAQRAVLAHELNHVRRRDWLWVIAEEVVRSVFWFHPAVWWLVSRIQLARETVVDELSILATNNRRTYLDTLLAFADDTGLVSPPAFSARRHLFYRVMLLSKEGGMSSIRVAFASVGLALALVAGAWEAVNAFPLHGSAVVEQAPPAQSAPAAPKAQSAPPRDPLSPEGLHRLAMEYFEKASKNFDLTPEQKLQAIATAISYEDRALARNMNYLPAMTGKLTLLTMQARLTTDVSARAQLDTQIADLQSAVAALKATMPPPPPPPPPGGIVETEAPPEFKDAVERLKPVRIGGGVKTPMKTRDVKPEYPAEAQAARVQGVVILEGIIDAEGNVAAARILRPIPMLNEAALGAVQQWKFTPTLLNGEPVAIIMTVTVNFTLQ